MVAQETPILTYRSHNRPLLVRIDKEGVVKALHTLNDELKAAGLAQLISNKRPHQIIGREVNPGSF